ncbi:hypothetical protein DPMN_178536 [Dreissena polymorpha]|uniref:CUB domain-containing protein n=1 Tax=Dreissena polymorpha TaxID=45954 RepID=A0A9D4EAS4_DREPO|nr:hypothetical protein DPMN_178536 [Dreissena polymorpha]
MYDYVKLRDGPFGFSDFIARFCGNEFPVTVQTKSRFLLARFTSYNVMESDGFRAVYGFKKKKEDLGTLYTE